MSDTYNYETGAIHNDNKRVLQIGNVASGDIGKLLGAFFQEGIEEAVLVKNNDSRQVIMEELLDMMGQGVWTNGITAEGIKGMLTTVLGIGETPLSDKEKGMSDELWYMLEHGRGDRVKIICENLVGYFAERKLFANNDTPALSVQFFGDKKSIDNINKGKNGRLSKVTPLLDAYVPKLNKKR